MKTALNFKPKQSVKNLVSVLSDKGRDVIVKRYGLGKESKRMTLDAIGKLYGITRERVRQIENHSIEVIRKSKKYADEKSVFEELEKIIRSLGGVVVEQDLLDYISKDKEIQNQVNFLLVIGHPFTKMKEDDDFKHRWFIDEDLAKKIHGALKKLYENIGDDELVSEQEMVKTFLGYIENISEEYRKEEVAKRWLCLSKGICRNPLGEWGKASSQNVNTKGMRDYAYLILRKHGSPIHFREVAKAITAVFNKKAHVATTHNELIKDPRFVLVGRGLYALKEWGYMDGVVKDVISKLVEKYGPMTKDEIIAKVLKERYVKENTIVINLQNKKCFRKNKEGKYENC